MWNIYLYYLFIMLSGLEEEGFEMLDQLAYLYLANNKVSDAPGFELLRSSPQND